MSETLTPARVLVIQTSYLGDLVLATPVFAALKRRWPQARLTVLARPECAPVLRSHPDVDAIMVGDKRGIDSGLSGLVRMARRLRAEHFDLGISLHRGARSALLLALAGIRLRVGFRQGELSLLYNRRVWRDAGRHDVDRQLSILDGLGIAYDAGSILPSVRIDDLARRSVDAMLAAAGIPPFAAYVAVAPGAAWETKRWPTERFAELGRRLLALGENVVYLGTLGEIALIEQIRRAAGGGVSLAGRTDTAELAAAAARASAVVCNDSAPMHLAQAVGVPVVAVVGPTTLAQGFMPRAPASEIVRDASLSCQPQCNFGGRDCPYGTAPCLWNVTAEQVLLSIDRLRQGSRLACHEQRASEGGL